MKRVKIAKGLTLPGNGALRPIRTKAGIRHVLTRANAAAWHYDPTARLDLLPVDAFSTKDGQPLAAGHRVFALYDFAGAAPVTYLIEVIAPHSPDRGHAPAALMVEVCDRLGVDPRPALLHESPTLALYCHGQLQHLLREHQQQACADGARLAAEEGAPADLIEAIANGYPEGKRDVRDWDGIEFMVNGAATFFFGQVELPA